MAKVEVLLIEPPSPRNLKVLRILGSIGVYKTDMCWPPLDLMIISGILDKHNISNAIVDANVTRKSFFELKAIIESFNPRLIVFTTSTPTIYSDIKVAKIAKSVSRNILTTAVGTHIMALPKETLCCTKDLDVAIYNEPEKIILNLVKNKYDFSNTKGIWYRENGRLLQTEPALICEDLDELGMPSHDKVPVHLYNDPLIKSSSMTLTYGQRGCINSCIYCCSDFYKPLRVRSIEYVINELKWIKKLGINQLRFFDLGFTNNIKWANKLLDKIIENDLNINWACDVRSDKINYKLARKMKIAGCCSVSIGVESYSQKILNRVKKNTTPKIIEQAVYVSKKAGLEVMLHFIFGLPGETKETMNKSIKFAKKLNPDIVAFGIATPHPATEFYNYLNNERLLVTDDWSKYDPSLKPVYNYEHLSSEDIYNTMFKAYRGFYLRLSYIYKRILKIRSFYQFLNYIMNFLGFIKRYIWVTEFDREEKNV